MKNEEFRMKNLAERCNRAERKLFILSSSFFILNSSFIILLFIITHFLK